MFPFVVALCTCACAFALIASVFSIVTSILDGRAIRRREKILDQMISKSEPFMNTKR